MEGDREFLKAFSVLWSERLSSESSRGVWLDLWKKVYPDHVFEKKIEEIIKTQPYLSEQDKIREGIDHHTYPKLIELCQNQCVVPLQRDDIERAVWHHSSGVNFKKTITTRQDP